MAVLRRVHMKKSVNILGTEYKIEKHKVSEDETLKGRNLSGYCNSIQKLIVYADVTEDAYFGLDEDERAPYVKETLRHEVIHAFFNESGLEDNSSNVEHWAVNEEMVDWFAIQSPKIFKVFQELEII